MMGQLPRWQGPSALFKMPKWQSITTPTVPFTGKGGTHCQTRNPVEYESQQVMTQISIDTESSPLSALPVRGRSSTSKKKDVKLGYKVLNQEEGTKVLLKKYVSYLGFSLVT